MRQAAQHETDHGQVDPGLFTAGEHFIIFAEPAPGGKPGEGPLDDPASFEHMKAFGTDLLPIDFDPFRDQDASQATPRVFDDLDLPAELRIDPLAEAFLLICAIGPDQLETRKVSPQRRKQELATASVLKVGFMHQHMQDQPIRVDEQMTFPALDLFSPIEAAKPPFWLVFTDWLSMIAALGVGSRPCFTRTCSRNAACIRCHVPSLRHRRK